MDLDPEIEIRRLEREVEDLSIELARFESLREKTPQGQDTVTFFLNMLDNFQKIAPRFLELQRESQETHRDSTHLGP